MSNSVLMIDLERFRSGELPMVCVRTGVRASHFESIKSRREEHHEAAAALHRGSLALTLRALTDVVRPTGLLPFAYGKEDVDAITAYYVRKSKPAQGIPDPRRC